jgi:hypothetical protein
MSIKPVAKVKHSVTGFIDLLGPLDLVEGTKLYHTPDTHRVVSVEVLIRAVWMLRPGLAVEEELRAIIEDKP